MSAKYKLYLKVVFLFAALALQGTEVFAQGDPLAQPGLSYSCAPEYPFSGEQVTFNDGWCLGQVAGGTFLSQVFLFQPRGVVQPWGSFVEYLQGAGNQVTYSWSGCTPVSGEPYLCEASVHVNTPKSVTVVITNAWGPHTYSATANYRVTH